MSEQKAQCVSAHIGKIAQIQGIFIVFHPYRCFPYRCYSDPSLIFPVMRCFVYTTT